MHSTHIRQSFDFSAPPEKIWRIVSDKHKLSRELGGLEIGFDREASESGQLSLRGTSRVLGLTLSWIERPFTFVAFQGFELHREYDQGPLERYLERLRLYPLDEGTRLDIEVSFVPRTRLASWLLPAVAWLTRRKLRTFASRLRHYLSGELASPWTPLHSAMSEAGEARLRAIRETLAKEFSADAVDRLVHLVKTGENEALDTLRPYRLADEWDLERVELLELCLTATRHGLLEMRWQILCPSCRAGVEAVEHLAELPHKVHCPACDVPFEADFDRSVELCFKVSPAIRDVSVRRYCSGGPAYLPHVVAQQSLEPGAHWALSVPLETDAYRLRTGDLSRTLPLECGPGLGPSVGTVFLDEEGFHPPVLRLSGGACTLEVVNRLPQPQRLTLEQASWQKGAVTAAEVTTLQRYRDLFSSEVLRADEQFSIRSMALLFTDLRRSSQMYLALGDAPAYSRVRDHFEQLFNTVRSQRGAVVKTIGDSVMAAFMDPADALEAALKIVKSFQSRSAARVEAREPLVLRVGVHAGPCIAVTANERLDYFGATVNFAARLEGLGEGGDAVISEAVYQDPGVQARLSNTGTRLEVFHTPVKGFEGNYRLYRYRPPKS